MLPKFVYFNHDFQGYVPQDIYFKDQGELKLQTIITDDGH